MPHFAVTAVGTDRPGIVAAVSGVLQDQGCNLEDTSMTILRGHFAMMLIVRGPEGLTANELEQALETVGAELGLAISVRLIDDDVPRSPEGEAWTASVYGADRPGIVHAVTSLLASKGANVVDLSTRVIGEPDRPVYAMILEVTLPPGVDGELLANQLRDLSNQLGVDCGMHPCEADIF